MDFFAAQDHARKQTKKLVVYFVLAVIGIIASIYAVCALLFSLDIPVSELAGGQGGSSYRSSYQSPSTYQSPSARSHSGGYSQRADTQAPVAGQGYAVRWWNPRLLAIVSGAVLLVVLGASAAKTLQLRSGGGAVARSLGGRRVDSGTRQADERRLMNIVEEMALASGVPVPEVYVLDAEDGINAFAAGHSPHDAAVAVTRGCLEKLTRDELQGVIAHEFAHILNGDMRLNLRLIGILFGILVLAVLGQGLMRSALWTGGARRNNKDNSGMVLLILGLAVMVIGYIGVFFGRLIQSAISRQREFLADASAVQFTRYPDGIANALLRIGREGSRLHSEHAQETAHMFFANGLRQSLGGGFATHPPLEARIRAIKPDWDGKFVQPGTERPLYREAPRRRDTAGGTAASAQSAAAGGVGVPGGSAAGAAVMAAGRGMRAQAALAAIGTLATEDIVRAQSLHGQAHALLSEAGSDPLAAKALIYALMLCDEDMAGLSAHLQSLQEQIEPEVFVQIEPFARKLAGQDALRLPLLELAMPALGKLDRQQLLTFAQGLEQLARSDERLTFGELAIVALVRHKIARKAASRAEPVVADAAALANAFSIVLTAVTRAGAGAGEGGETGSAAGGQSHGGGGYEPELQVQMQAVFDAACARAPLFAGLVSLRASVDNEELLPALEALGRAALALKKQILAAAAEAVLQDGHVCTREAEWLRLIAACLDCPMPPLAV